MAVNIASSFLDNLLQAGFSLNQAKVLAAPAYTVQFNNGIAVNGTTTITGTLTATPANSSITLSPTGTGTVTIAPATAGNINNMAIGQTTPAAVKVSNLQASYTDSSGTPGNVTNNSPRGRVAFAAAASTVTVTSSLVTAASTVIADLNFVDATLKTVVAVSGAGTFTITGNAAATAITACDFIVIN